MPPDWYNSPIVTKAAAKKKKTTTAVDDDIGQLIEITNAKRLFIGATLNMSWRLAFTIVVPVVAGVQLDKYFDSSPSLTLAGFILAIAGGCAAVWSTVKEVNEIQAEEDKENKNK